MKIKEEILRRTSEAAIAFANCRFDDSLAATRSPVEAFDELVAAAGELMEVSREELTKGGRLSIRHFHKALWFTLWKWFGISQWEIVGEAVQMRIEDPRYWRPVVVKNPETGEEIQLELYAPLLLAAAVCSLSMTQSELGRCPICWNIFIKNPARKYCGRRCANLASVRAYQKRKKGNIDGKRKPS